MRSTAGVHELAVGEIADPAHAPPVPVRRPTEKLHEGPLALVVDDDIDKRMGAQKPFGLVGHARPAEDDGLKTWIRAA